jgi:hypothetical protein
MIHKQQTSCSKHISPCACAPRCVTLALTPTCTRPCWGLVVCVSARWSSWLRAAHLIVPLCSAITHAHKRTTTSHATTSHSQIRKWREALEHALRQRRKLIVGESPAQAHAGSDWRHACMHVRMYACTYLCMYVPMQVFMDAVLKGTYTPTYAFGSHVYNLVHTYTCTCVHTNTHRHDFVFAKYLRTRVGMCLQHTYNDKNTHTHTHTHTHAHIRTYIHAHQQTIITQQG